MSPGWATVTSRSIPSGRTAPSSTGRARGFIAIARLSLRFGITPPGCDEATTGLTNACGLICVGGLYAPRIAGGNDRLGSAGPPLATLRQALDVLGPLQQEPPQVRVQDQSPHHATEHAERCRKAEIVDHQRPIAVVGKRVAVGERLKRAADHFVLEHAGALAPRHAHGQALPDSEVDRLPRHLV